MTDTHTLAEWSERPFTSYDKRHATVHHRIDVETVSGVGVDVRHEVRCPNLDGYPSKWTVAEVVEVRPHGVERITADAAGWWM